MNITQLCKRYGLQYHGSLESAWDAHGPTGIVLMQLWHAPNQKVHDHPLPGAQLRVRCFPAVEADGATGATGADDAARRSRVRSIAAVEQGAQQNFTWDITALQVYEPGRYASRVGQEQRIFGSERGMLVGTSLDHHAAHEMRRKRRPKILC